MIEAREGLFKAVPFSASDPAKYLYVLDRIVEHESEWTDFQSDPDMRRRIATSVFAEALAGTSVIFEVWYFGEEPQIVGLIHFSHIVPKVDAQFHPVFFDGKIRNLMGKREILLRSLDWAYQTWDLHRISVQLPENRYALVRFVREKLGFRFEAENRSIKQQKVVAHGYHKKRVMVALTPNWREAEWGSRRYQALYQGGKWLDMLLLSQTREEFAQFVRPECPVSSTDPTPSKPSPAT